MGRNSSSSKWIVCSLQPGTWAAAVHWYCLPLVLFHCFPILAVFLGWPGRLLEHQGPQHWLKASSIVFLPFFWNFWLQVGSFLNTEDDVEMEFEKCWQVHKVRPNVTNNSCEKKRKQTFLNHFFNFEMKLINNAFGLLKHFSVKRDLPSTHSVKRMPNQNWTKCNFFLLTQNEFWSWAFISLLRKLFQLDSDFCLLIYCLYHHMDKNKDLHLSER